jgi:chemotaxis protein CheX
MAEMVAEGEQPVSPEIRAKLVEPFITATRTALREMANTEMVVRAVCRSSSHPASDDISAVLQLTPAIDGSLVLSFPERTAAFLARQVLAGVTAEVDNQLIRDCVAEIGNVVAGQAKALLAGTPFHFVFSLPRVIIGIDDLQVAGLDCLFIAFDGGFGKFALRLYRRS